MPELITRTSGGDRIGRTVTYSDEPVPHQIRLVRDGKSATTYLVGCTCGAPRVSQRWEVPIEDMWTAWATLDHQPDPTTEFSSWARFVSTDEFLAKHLVGSILGLALNTLGVAALAGAVLVTGDRVRPAVWGFVLTVLGSAGLIAGFGVAAFAQPAIGALEMQGVAGAHDVYDDVYGIPTFVTLIGGAVLFSAASMLLARAAAAIDDVPGWARFAYGASGPLIGFLGIAFGPFQTLGSVAAVAGGIGIAAAVRRAGATNRTATP